MASDAAIRRVERPIEPPQEPEIVFVTRKWAPATGGMETYSLRLTEALSAIEPVELIALHGRADNMPPRAPALLMFPLKVIARILRRRTPPRVVHLGDMAIWPLALLWLLHRRTVVALSAHGTDVAYHRRGGIKGRLYGAYLRLGARLLRDAQVIANSQATLAVAMETGWTKAVVVPLATDLSGPEPDGTHDGSVLFAGRLVERKGCGWFVREVLPLLPDGVRLKVAGTAWDETEAAVLSHPRVDHLGALPQDELARAYARAMCVIVPNIELPNGEYEGFGLVACEAAACGGVVLAANHGGLREAVIDGTTGRLLLGGDSKAWADAIEDVAGWSQDQRRALVSTARSRAIRWFDWRRVADQTRAAYEGDKAEAFDLAAQHG